jgi:N-acetylglucosaminyl-diphospho-decaprenol L-rhamnosyltransferase
VSTSSEEPNTAALEVLILSYDSSVVIERLLATLSTLLPDTPVAIREHSDAPGAIGRLEMLAAAHPTFVRVSVDARNPGFGAGCNALAAASNARHLLFLNPDTELVSWPYQHALPADGRLVGPLMVGSGDPSRHYGVRYRVRDEIARSWFRHVAPRPTGSGFVSGAAFLIAKTDFDRIGGFDESYFLFYEDIDLCLRANAAGIGTYVDERFTVRHAGAHSTSGRFGMSLMWSYESAVRFHRAHGSPVAGYRCYVVADSIARAAAHGVRRRGATSRSYLSLAWRAARELFGASKAPQSAHG